MLNDTAMPYTVALTGGVASGKSTVAQYFAQLGVFIVDADVVARQLVEPNQPALAEIVAYFGDHILTEKGELNRAALRTHIFQYPEAKHWLEGCLHPRIRQAMKQTLTQMPNGQNNKQYAIAVIPLLQETGIPDYVNRILVVDCSKEEQLNRLLKRDGINEQLARSMIEQQATRDDRIAIADDIINNNMTQLSEQNLMNQCQILHRQYQQFST